MSCSSPGPGCAPQLMQVTEASPELHSCSFCNLDHGTRRVPAECKEVLEKSAAKALASWLPRSRELHHIRIGGQFVCTVCCDQLAKIPWTFANIDCRFNWAARKLHKRLDQLGAKEVYPRGEADDQHEEGLVATKMISCAPWNL